MKSQNMIETDVFDHASPLHFFYVRPISGIVKSMNNQASIFNVLTSDQLLHIALSEVAKSEMVD